MALFLAAVIVLGIIDISQAGPEYDFEDGNLAQAASGFSASGGSPSSTLNIRNDKHKGGKRSLLWEWGKSSSQNPAKLSLDLGNLKIKDDELKKGGLKFWMYHDPGKAGTKSTMKIVFRGSSNGISKDVDRTNVKLDFKGWRAVWIGYAEFFEGKKANTNAGCTPINPANEGIGLDEIDSVEFRITSNEEDKLYIDLVRFAAKMNKQTRDLVVQQVSSMRYTRSANGVSTFYDEKDFWQMSLRWQLLSPTSCTSKQVTPTKAEKDEIDEIEKRLENWYASDSQISQFDNKLNDLGAFSQSKSSFTDFQYERWKDLSQKSIQKAAKLLTVVLRDKPSLFALLSDQGDKDNMFAPNGKSKFFFMFSKVLLPLAIKYSFTSRKNNVPKRNSQNVDKSVDCEDLSDDPELDNIVKLLGYIENQGWAEGSGIGTLAHEMNKSGAGFIHSMFLLRNVLKRRCSTLFGRLLKTMKWYTDYNEIYQQNDDYIYSGTTADRMRTILIYRLMIVLMQTDQNDRVRDMKCFKNWVDHILNVNKGLGGLIKPDFTGFHHKTFYGSAYVPQALHNAAIVQYLLDGTSFALDSVAKKNLRKVLGVLRTVAVKYSTPNSLCGRFPKYDKAILAELLPAYAYISYVHGNSKSGTSATVNKPEMFLRLAEPLDDPDLKAYLEKGDLKSPIHYFNTIGSLKILQQVKTASTSITKENSPSGHWSKNYASLSIHRRNDWSVAAKGFNRYTWDFEKADAQNVYGIFVSYGSLQISNSEAALKTYDVDNGWDWTKVPGATTVNLDLDSIRTDKARYYNPGGFAGGVAMVGSDNDNDLPQNGAFGMKFKKPDYEMKTNKASPLKKMNFEFKKSYFFYDHLIVAVGSNILLEDLDKKDGFYAQTTLFQDKLVDPSKSSTISIGNTMYDLRLLLKSWKSSTLTSASSISLIDTHGNKYKVKIDKNTVVNVKISDQESRKSDGCLEKTKARYATAWIVHGKDKKNKKSKQKGQKGKQNKNSKQKGKKNKNSKQKGKKNKKVKRKRKRSKKKYEYAILVKDGNEELLSKYRVKRIGNNKAHAVHIQTTSVKSEGMFGYSIFDHNIDNNFGPVKTTDSPCMIMAKKEGGFLYLSISNPSLEFKEITTIKAGSRLENTCSGTNRKDLKPDGCLQSNGFPSNSDDVRSKMMFCMECENKEITVTLNCDGFEQDDIVFARVDGEKVDQGDIIQYVEKKQGLPEVKFLKLVDGFTTEIKIRNSLCTYVTS